MGVFQMSEAMSQVSYVVLPVEEKLRTEGAANRREKMHKIKMSHTVTRLINCQDLVHFPYNTTYWCSRQDPTSDNRVRVQRCQRH